MCVRCVYVCACVWCARVYDEKKFVNPRNWYFQQLVIIRYKSGVYHYMPYPRWQVNSFFNDTFRNILLGIDRLIFSIKRSERARTSRSHSPFFNFCNCVHNCSSIQPFSFVKPWDFNWIKFDLERRKVFSSLILVIDPLVSRLISFCCSYFDRRILHAIYIYIYI